MGLPDEVARQVDLEIDIKLGLHDLMRKGLIVDGEWYINSILYGASYFFHRYREHGVKAFVLHHILDYYEIQVKRLKKTVRHRYATGHLWRPFYLADHWVRCLISNAKCDILCILGKYEEAEKELRKAWLHYSEAVANAEKEPKWGPYKTSLESLKRYIGENVTEQVSITILNILLKTFDEIESMLELFPNDIEWWP